jgi:broad specificity phosphatase PhoE
MAGRFCGHSNPPINDRGHRQIRELVRAMERESIDAVYASDLLRAVTTAKAIAETSGASVLTVPELREIDFGEWEGLTWEEIESRDRAYARKWSSAFPRLPAPGGERFEAFRNRVLNEVKALLAIKGQKCLAVVTHGGVMRVVLRTFCGVSEEQAWERTRGYCSLFRYKPQQRQ